MQQDITTDVLISGGGPSGLMLAIELGCRGIACVVLEEDLEPPTLPKANATSARTMEHYRRRGFSNKIRALGLPDGHAQDVAYFTSLVGKELARFKIPSKDKAASQDSFGDYTRAAWPTPELPHRGQQMYIEPILAQEAESYPSVSVRFGMRATSFKETSSGVIADVLDVATQNTIKITADYAVGCDGPRSLVRQTMGVAYSGQGGQKRDFFGGQMVSIYFSSPDFYDVIKKPKAWQYWTMSPRSRGLMVSINGVDTFAALAQLKDGQTMADLDADKILRDVVGAPFTYNIIACTPWTAGFALVADQFQKGRLMIVGDAAHLFTPTGGMGYNTSVDDAVNLGWKLAAVLQGWAPPALLASYESERKPMALRNTAFARQMADSIGSIAMPAMIDDEGSQGDKARSELGKALTSHVANEFNIPGLQLGVRYQSPIVATESSPAPPDTPNAYVPSSYPGARAPHVRIGDASLLDLLSCDFTLLARVEADTTAWVQAALNIGLPMAVLRMQDQAVLKLYEADLVLVRPDHHIAWRGSDSTNPTTVLRSAVGYAADIDASVAHAQPAVATDTAE